MPRSFVLTATAGDVRICEVKGEPAMRLQLETLPGEYSIYRLPPEHPLPSAATTGFVSVTRTDQELSLLGFRGDWDPLFASVPDCQVQHGWCGLRVVGPLPFDAVGILSRLCGVLADAKVPLLAIATYDTDYLFVSIDDRQRAIEAMTLAGMIIVPEPTTEAGPSRLFP